MKNRQSALTSLGTFLKQMWPFRQAPKIEVHACLLWNQAPKWHLKYITFDPMPICNCQGQTQSTRRFPTSNFVGTTTDALLYPPLLVASASRSQRMAHGQAQIQGVCHWPSHHQIASAGARLLESMSTTCQCKQVNGSCKQSDANKVMLTKQAWAALYIGLHPDSDSSCSSHHSDSPLNLTQLTLDADGVGQSWVPEKQQTQMPLSFLLSFSLTWLRLNPYMRSWRNCQEYDGHSMAPGYGPWKDVNMAGSAKLVLSSQWRKRAIQKVAMHDNASQSMTMNAPPQTIFHHLMIWRWSLCPTGRWQAHAFVQPQDRQSLTKFSGMIKLFTNPSKQHVWGRSQDRQRLTPRNLAPPPNFWMTLSASHPRS